MNWTVESVVFLISSILMMFNVYIYNRQYRRIRSKFFLYMLIEVLLIASFVVCGFLQYFILSKIIFSIQALITIPVAIVNILIVDALRRYTIDPIKMFITGLISTVVILGIWDQDNIMSTELPIGGATLKATGTLFIAGVFVTFQILFVFFYYTFLVYRHSQSTIKTYSQLFLVGGIIYGLVPFTSYILGLTALLPGINGICFSTGLLVFGMALVKCPELHTVMLRRSNEAKKRYLMQRFFFHDILNTVSTIQSSIEILDEYPDGVDRDQYLTFIREGIERLLEEVQLQQQLNLAEQGDLIITPEIITAKDLLEDLVESFTAMIKSQDKTIIISQDSVTTSFQSDRTIIRRILSNMIKNAIEAIDTGDTVTIGIEHHPSERKVVLWVQNPGVIPVEIERQIFSRIESTKGTSRGLGTYSMRILAEQIFGEVGFTTDETTGTRFYLEVPESI